MKKLKLFSIDSLCSKGFNKLQNPFKKHGAFLFLEDITRRETTKTFCWLSIIMTETWEFLRAGLKATIVEAYIDVIDVLRCQLIFKSEQKICKRNLIA